MILKSGTREMKAMSDTILKVTNVTKRFGGVCALDNVNLELKKGEIQCLVGGNGSGKSTLIKIISGFYKPDGGTVEIDGDCEWEYRAGGKTRLPVTLKGTSADRADFTFRGFEYSLRAERGHFDGRKIIPQDGKIVITKG